MGQAGLEIQIILGCWLHPLHFGKGGHSGQNLILNLRLTGDVFGPHVGLRAQDVMPHACRQVGCHGIEVIDFLERVASPESRGLVPSVFGLIIVKIEWPNRCHNDVMSQFSTLGTRLCASPRHDGGCRVHITA